VNTGAPSSTPLLTLEEAEARVLGIQTKLHRWATDDSDRRVADLFNLVGDPAVLLVAWRRVKGQQGGAHGWGGRPDRLLHPAAAWRGELSRRAARRLKARGFWPLPVRERLIPKPGSGKLRMLGIPTVRDRVVQAALKLVWEPIVEADFLPCSYGFRPGRRAQDAIAEIHVLPAHHTATSGSWKAISRHALTRSTTPRS
jgi:RNA-directed DNA polymerase